ncbi:MAG: HAD family hydrolase [Prevotellaceae bacterium]|nr:HAD family hydrolase [Prevotellaceae bacterium]
MQQYEAYIFDLDGTLLDTLQDLTNSVNYALRTFCMPERSRDEVRQFVGNGVRLLIERAVPQGTKDGMTIKVFETFRNHYLEHSLDNTRPYSGIMETISELHRRGKQLAIVSNKLQPAVTELNNRFFSQYIGAAIGERIGIRRKPSPDMISAALAEIDATCENAVYVGDSDVDILTAQNSSLPCISVLWGFRDKDCLLSHGATCCIASPEELL